MGFGISVNFPNSMELQKDSVRMTQLIYSIYCLPESQTSFEEPTRTLTLHLLFGTWQQFA